MHISLTGRTALVTGAGRNIGRAIATGLAQAGAAVICAYELDRDAAEETAQAIGRAGGQASVAKVDLRDPADITAACHRLTAGGSHVDILVNNAAVRPRTHLEELSVAEWDMTLDINLRGPFLLTQALLPGMQAAGWGRVVNISGLDAYRGSIDRVHVTASKLGVVGLSRALAAETALSGITVNTVVPGHIDTVRSHPEWSDDIQALRADALNDIPMARLGESDHVAFACVFLASPQASYITGQELFVTGGEYPLVRQRARERVRKAQLTQGMEP